MHILNAEKRCHPPSTTSPFSLHSVAHVRYLKLLTFFKVPKKVLCAYYFAQPPILNAKRPSFRLHLSLVAGQQFPRDCVPELRVPRASEATEGQPGHGSAGGRATALRVRLVTWIRIPRLLNNSNTGMMGLQFHTLRIHIAHIITWVTVRVESDSPIVKNNMRSLSKAR